jgi:hypothetical protein
MVLGLALAVAAGVARAFGEPDAVFVPVLAGAMLVLVDPMTSWRCRRSMKLFGKLWSKVEPEFYALPVAGARYMLLLGIVLTAIAIGLAFGPQPWQVWPAFLAVLSYPGLFLYQLTTLIRRHHLPR